MSGSNGKGSRKGVWNRKVRWHRFWILEDEIEDYLYGKKLHLPLLREKPETMKVEEWAFLDRQVLGVIKLTLSRSIAHNVIKQKTAYEIGHCDWSSDVCSSDL